MESLIEFAHLAQVRETENVEDAQKQILVDQLEELDKNSLKCMKSETYLSIK